MEDKIPKKKNSIQFVQKIYQTDLWEFSLGFIVNTQKCPITTAHGYVTKKTNRTILHYTFRYRLSQNYPPKNFESGRFGLSQLDAFRRSCGDSNSTNPSPPLPSYHIGAPLLACIVSFLASHIASITAK